MSSIVLDHIAIAMPRMADAMPLLVGQLGGVPDFGASSRVFRFGQWRFQNGARLEVIEPRGEDGFVHRFLATRGPGIHHVTFKVPSLREACVRAEAHGYTIVGFDDSDPRWKEAFLHPKQALGVVVQLAESITAAGGGRRWQPPPAPPEPPPAVELLGLRLRARSRERADTQWRIVLAGEGTDDRSGTRVYGWSGSPLRLFVDFDAVAPEGPLAIEFVSDRKIPRGSELDPVLGGVFSQRAAGAD
jgi:methylmalonyl-CoA/ethylmalonyl-CoA epimerase